MTTTNSKSDVMVFHKESCITCKTSIIKIQRTKREVKKRDFFKEPFSEKELKKIINMTGLKPVDMIRKRDKMYKELEMGIRKYSDNQIIKLMVRHPGLITRPIIISENKAFVGKTSIEKI